MVNDSVSRIKTVPIGSDLANYSNLREMETDNLQLNTLELSSITFSEGSIYNVSASKPRVRIINGVLS